VTAPRRPVTTVIVPPVDVDVDGVKATIVEVHAYTAPDGGRRYIVACYLECDGYRSQLFHVDAADNVELRRKLKVEAAKMRLQLAAGFTQPFQRIA